MNKLKFLGRGSAFNIDEKNTSAYLKNENSLLLIDCGETVFTDIIKSNLLNDVDNIYILITHLHGDHAGSLSSLIFYCYYMKNIIPNVFGVNELEMYLKLQGTIKGFHYNLITNLNELDLLSSFELEEIEKFDVEHEPAIELTTSQVNDVVIKTEEKKILNSYAYLFKFLDSSSFYYSGDCSEFNKEVFEKYKDDANFTMYQDTTSMSFKGNIHTDIKQLEYSVPSKYRHKIHCMHINSSSCEYLVQSLGFNVVSSNDTINTCPVCNGKLLEEYQVKIFNEDNMKMEFTKCCSLHCANDLKEKNSKYWHSLYSQVDRQCIQKLK